MPEDVWAYNEGDLKNATRIGFISGIFSCLFIQLIIFILFRIGGIHWILYDLLFFD
jgi:hypothetical protein